jgi:hypothetical protein
MIEDKKRDFEVQMEFQLQEYYKPINISSVGMKRSSLFDKYGKMKKFIENGEYKNL